MAALESAFGEEAMADINPSLDRENLAATECSEFQFNANSFTGQSQLCILEPNTTEIIDNEGLVTDQLTTAEKIALEDSVKTEAVLEYPWHSDKVVTNVSAPHQDENLSVKDEANRQSLKQINYRDNQNKNLYFCDRRKDFQQPSLFAQQKNVFCASKVSMQSKQLNWKQLEICNPSVPDQKRQTKICLIGDQCEENNQSLSHLSKYYKNVLPNENSQSEASSLISLVPAPLQAENIIEYVDEAVGPNPVQVTDQRTETKNLHICDQCGKEYQWLSELIQHQLLYFGEEADTQCQLHMESRNPRHLAPVPILFQENSMCVTAWETFQQKSRNHNTHAKMRSSLLKRHILPREELTRQSEPKINKSSTLSFVHHVRGNTFADSCEMSNLNPMLTSLCTGKQHSNQCGRCCHCLCAQQDLDNLELKADRDERFHLGAYSPESVVPILLQAEKTLSENSKNPIGQKNYTKNLYTCNCDRSDFQCHCLLAKHHLHVPLGGETDTQDQFKIQTGSLSQFQIKSIESSETVKPQSNLTTNQDFHIKSPTIYKECGKDFQWSSALAWHQVVHSGKVNGKQCPSKVDDQNDSLPGLMDFDQPSHLKTNQLTEKNKPYACGHCGKSFKWPSDLARHKHVHSSRKIKRDKGTKLSLICDQCGRGFMYPSDLARHKHTHSRQKILRGKCTKLNKYYTCSLCQKSFQWRSQLTRHEQIHSRNKLVRDKCTKLNKSRICDQCGKGFKWPSDLARHKQTHSRKQLLRGKCSKLKLIKSCICDLCGKGFKWPSKLARHKLTHSRKKILRGKSIKLNKYYTCSQCRKSFQWRSQLTQHEQIHSRSILMRGKCTKLNKSYICGQCGKGFPWPSDLARHERTHSRK